MSAVADEGAAGEPVVLAEPVRQRLVQIASDVLGRLAADTPEEVPASLRAIARFTAAKRVRLGAAVLSAALDADEQFRGRVAELVADATPQLVEAVRDSRPTPASDPMDTAVVAYLVRPDGWRQVVAGITARWSDERSGREAAAEEIARLRAELAETRARLRAESARAEQAVAAAAAGSADEATRLRNSLRVRTGELRAAERERDAARAELDRHAAERERAAAEAAGLQAELVQLRARVGELERTAGSARRGSRAEREVDDARLRLLLDTLADATAGIRRELALPAGVLRPADAVVAAGPALAGDAAPGREVRDAAELDRMLALPQLHVIVDGYNVTKTGYPELSLADQRTRLVTVLASVRARAGTEITVVFDGAARPPAQPRAPRGVRVLFSAPGELADDVIRRLVAAEPAGRPLLVVTSDRAVVLDVRRDGARTVPSAVLLDRLG